MTRCIAPRADEWALTGVNGHAFSAYSIRQKIVISTLSAVDEYRGWCKVFA